MSGGFTNFQAALVYIYKSTEYSNTGISLLLITCYLSLIVKGAVGMIYNLSYYFSVIIYEQSEQMLV